MPTLSKRLLAYQLWLAALKSGSRFPRRYSASECFGSLADICSAKRHVRFTLNSDRKRRHAANGHVRFTLESGHVQCIHLCLLWANSGHLAATAFGSLSSISSAKEIIRFFRDVGHCRVRPFHVKHS